MVVLELVLMRPRGWVFHIFFLLPIKFYFCDASREQLLYIKMMIFFEAVQACVNVDKWNSPRSWGGQFECLADILCCRLGSLPMTYLGMPLGAQFKKISIWNFFYREDGKEIICLKEIIFVQGRQTLLKSILLSLWAWSQSFVASGDCIQIWWRFRGMVYKSW